MTLPWRCVDHQLEGYDLPPPRPAFFAEVEQGRGSSGRILEVTRTSGRAAVVLQHSLLRMRLWMSYHFVS